MAHIVSMLGDSIAALLLAACQTAVDETDDTRAHTVREGRLQSDPTTNVVSILIHPNDPEQPDKWAHEVVRNNITALSNPWGDADFRIPSGLYEIGGGEFWWRRFTVHLQMFWMEKGLTRNQALDYSHLVLGRAEEAIKEGAATFGALQDEWDEQVWGWYVRKSRCVERGGPPNDWIWDGKLWLEFGTNKP